MDTTGLTISTAYFKDRNYCFSSTTKGGKRLFTVEAADLLLPDCSVMASFQGKVTCWLCNRFSYATHKGLFRHMAAVHSCDPNFHIVCGLEGCSRNYTNFYSFKRHVYRNHRAVVGKDLRTPSAHEDDDDVQTICNSGVDPSLSLHSNDDERRSVAGFVMKSRAVYKTTEAHLSSIIDDFSALLDRTADYAKQKMLDVAKKFDLPATVSDELTKVFDSPAITQQFAGFETKYLQDKFMREEMGLVVRFSLYML